MKRARTESEADARDWKDHTNRVLIYLSLGERKHIAFPPRCFMILTQNKFNILRAIFDGEEDMKDAKVELKSSKVDVQCPVDKENLKYAVSFAEKPEAYKTFFKYVMLTLGEAFEDSGALTISL